MQFFTYLFPVMGGQNLSKSVKIARVIDKSCDNYRVSGALEKLEHETILQDRASDR